MIGFLLTFLIAAPIMAIGQLYKRQPKQLTYRQERNGSWIAEDRKVFGGTLTTWREITRGGY